MYLRMIQRRNKDGTTVRYVQLAHNEWDPATRQAKATIRDPASGAVLADNRLDRVSMDEGSRFESVEGGTRGFCEVDLLPRRRFELVREGAVGAGVSSAVSDRGEPSVANRHRGSGSRTSAAGRFSCRSERRPW